jgi:serine/threonine protein kinase
MTDLRTGLVVSDRYQLEAAIGRGAFAETWRALDRRLQRPVALKFLKSDLAADPQFAARFQREARIAAAITSDHTVQIYDVGQHGGLPWIAMEFVDGQSLRQLLNASDGCLDSDQATRIMRQILAGLGAVHAQGIIHRDLKPENVLITANGAIKIADFGISMAPDAVGLTSTGTTFGTAAYMAPEQGRGEPVSPATDLYSAGVVFFEMLTGRLPFMAPTVVAMLLAHQNRTPPSPASVDPRLASAPLLEAVVAQALQKNPERRFQSAPSMLAALSSQPPGGTPTIQMPRRTETIPIQTRPPQVVSARVLPAPRRSRAPVAMLGVVLIALLAAGAIYGTLAGWFADASPATPTTVPRPTSTDIDLPVDTNPVIEDQPTIGPAATEIVLETPTDQPIDEATATEVLIESETQSPIDDSGEPTESVLIDPLSTPDGQ